MNIKTAFNSLVFQYYLIYALLILELVGAKLIAFPFELTDTCAYILQSVLVLCLLVVVPVILKWFSIRTKSNRGLDFYVKHAKIQMWVLSIPAFAAGIAYFILKDMNSLLCYLIAFVVLIFSKPSVSKIESYMDRNDDMDESAGKQADIADN